MMIALHKRARTTPAIRAEIAASTESAKALACRFGVSEATIYKWKSRQSVQDRSHTAHRLQTTLTSAQETIVVHLRRTLLLPLDDLLAVTREFLCPDVSRSGLDRCLRRHGVGNLHALKPATPQEPHKAFKSYEPGYLHMDVKYLPQMQDETKRRYLFVAIDRATRWVFVAIKKDKTAASAGSFLKALHKACPLKIVKLLTDNGKEFTDRLFASRERAPSGNHEFDQLCQELGIEHRLTRPRTPKTNGMVERFNGRISDVLKTNRFNSALDLEETLLRYVALYNHQLPQSALQSKTPMQAMKGWYDSQPSLFHKRPYDRPGCDIYASVCSADRDGMQGAFRSPIAWLLARKATPQTARARAITRREELCRASLGSQSDQSSKAAIQCALPPSHIRHVIAQAIVFATNSPTEQIQHPCGVTLRGGGFHG